MKNFCNKFCDKCDAQVTHVTGIKFQSREQQIAEGFPATENCTSWICDSCFLEHANGCAKKELAAEGCPACGIPSGLYSSSGRCPACGYDRNAARCVNGHCGIRSTGYTKVAEYTLVSREDRARFADIGREMLQHEEGSTKWRQLVDRRVELIQDLLTDFFNRS